MYTDMIYKLIMNTSIEDLENILEGIKELKKCTHKTEEETKQDIDYLLETSKGYISPLRKMLMELENLTDDIPLTLAEIDKLSNISTEDMMNNFIKLGEEMHNGLGISEKYFSENGNASSLVNKNNF